MGFEPTVATRATTVFETVPFNRSGTSPVRQPMGIGGANYILNFQACVQFGVDHLLKAVRRQASIAGKGSSVPV